MKPYDLKARCKGVVDGKVCGRFLKLKASASSQVVMTCDDRKCKHDNTIKVVMLSDMLGYSNLLHTDPVIDQVALEAAEKLKAQLEEANEYIEKLEAL